MGLVVALRIPDSHDDVGGVVGALKRYEQRVGALDGRPLHEASANGHLGAVRLLLGRGAFSMIGFWAENSSYDGPDPFITPAITRDEWLYRGRFTIGAPVSFFAPGLPEAIKDINLIAQYEYETVDSNILNFDYKTHKAAFLISKRIAF
mgnify:CR=1 FL=1